MSSFISCVIDGLLCLKGAQIASRFPDWWFFVGLYWSSMFAGFGWILMGVLFHFDIPKTFMRRYMLVWLFSIILSYFLKDKWNPWHWTRWQLEVI